MSQHWIAVWLSMGEMEEGATLSRWQGPPQVASLVVILSVGCVCCVCWVEPGRLSLQAQQVEERLALSALASCPNDC